MKCCIIGLGVFGRNLVHNLAEVGVEVIAIDRKEENVSAIKDEAAAALVMDFEDPTPMDTLPWDDIDVLVVAIGDSFEGAMSVTVKAQELGAKRLICRVLSPMHRRLLTLMKIERLVVPEEFAARGLAHSLLMRGVLEGIDLGDGHAIIEATVPEGLIGGCIRDNSKAFSDDGVRLVTIKRKSQGILSRVVERKAEHVTLCTLGVVPLGETFLKDDIFVLFGPEKGLRRFLETHAGDAQ